MVMLSANTPAVIEANLNLVFDGIYREKIKQWRDVFKETTAIARSVHEEPVLFGFATAGEKAAGTPIAEDEGGQAYISRYVYTTYALMYSITQEAIEDGEHINLNDRWAEYLAISMHNTKELNAANILNLGFVALASGGYSVGDGVPLFGAHPLASGGTQSNTLTTNSNLSEAALEQLLIQIDLFTNQRGINADIRPQKLITHPSQRYNAQRILASSNRVGTTDNDNNAIKTLGALPADFVVMTRLTNANSFFVTTDTPAGLQYKERRSLKKTVEPDFRTGNIQCKAEERYVFGCTDWAGVYGSQGF
jgi:hypothetical protein